VIPVWSRIADAIASHGAAALVSLAAVAGSAPREAGARLVMRSDGAFWGTIGGGALEWAAMAQAREALAAGRGPARLSEWPLGPDLGQCCGGRVTTLVEVFDTSHAGEVARLAAMEAAGRFETRAVVGADGRLVRAPGAASGPPTGPGLPVALRRFAGLFPLREAFGDDGLPVLLFGAGHVGRALALALAPLPFRLRWVDTRADAFPAHLPGNAVAVRADEPAAEAVAAAPGTAVMVMTHSHPLDLAIVDAALRRDDLGGVGLIGSATKRARFVRRLRQAGLSASALDRLTCPIGVPGIGGREPAIIAAAVAAQLLQWSCKGSCKWSCTGARRARSVAPSRTIPCRSPEDADERR
jgi:xanthine dehydrogenase accessory factor